jgi:hypothetical protein
MLIVLDRPASDDRGRVQLHIADAVHEWLPVGGIARGRNPICGRMPR